MTPKYSLIISLYNAAPHIDSLFESLAVQKSKVLNQIEIIIIEDNSSDETLDQINHHRHKLDTKYHRIILINNKQNKGLAYNRQLGATRATGTHLFFLDARTIPCDTYFQEMIDKKQDIVIANVIIDKQRSSWDRAQYLFRKIVYGKIWGSKFDDVLLNYNTYQTFPLKGGGGAIFVKKDYFLSASQKFKLHKNVNDDTKIINELVKINPILKGYTPTIVYKSRTGFQENVHHIYNRGPKFIDYYSKPKTKYFLPLVLGISLSTFSLISLIAIPTLLLPGLMLVMTLYALISFYVSEDWIDFRTSMLIFPVITAAFIAGVYKGLFLKLTRQL